MAIMIALLRGINVGGKRMKMADLRTIFKSLGYPNAKTLLASGNIVFESSVDQTQLATILEAEILATFGFESSVILRTSSNLSDIIAKNPFASDTVAGNQLLVTFLRSAPSETTIAKFHDWHATEEIVHFHGREIFTHYPNGMGKSQLSNNVIERQLSIIGTARNWNTVGKLQSLVDQMGS